MDELARACVPQLAGLVHGGSGYDCAFIVEGSARNLCSVAQESVYRSAGEEEREGRRRGGEIRHTLCCLSPSSVGVPYNGCMVK